MSGERETLPDVDLADPKTPASAWIARMWVLFEHGDSRREDLRVLVQRVQELEAGVAERDRLRAAPAPTCRFGVVCPLHNFVHGAEAEELRQRLEAFEDELRSESSDYEQVAHVANMLRAILDEVDARDSAAFVEVRLELDATLVEVGGESPDILLRPGLRLKVTEEQARELAPHLYQEIHVVAYGGRLVSWSRSADR